MINIDTNIIVRLFLADDENQYKKAKDIFNQNCNFFISSFVLLEFVWVLKTKKYSRKEVYNAVSTLVELNNITGGNSQLFIHRLVELDCLQLEQLITNIQFEINQPRISQLFNTIFFTSVNQIEHLSSSFGYDVKGMTENLQKNEECLSALKELNCMYDISGVSSPELRLLMCVMMTGMNCYNSNKLSKRMNDFLNEPVSEDIEQKFKDL